MINIFGNLGNSHKVEHTFNQYSSNSDTFIINGKVFVNGKELEKKEFKENIKITEKIENLRVDSKSTEVIIRRGNELTIEYSGYYSGEKEPQLKKDIENKNVTITLDECNFIFNSQAILTVPDDIVNLTIKTVSGDITANDRNNIKDIVLYSISGNISSQCISEKLFINTISGDARIIVDCPNVHIGSTSGDIIITIESSKNILLSNTSGNILINSNRVDMYLNASTICGNIKNSCNVEKSDNVINATTVSGNINMF